MVVTYLLAGSLIAAGGHYHPAKRGDIGAAVWAVLLWLPALVYERFLRSE